MELKKCDRCNKMAGQPNDIGAVLNIRNFVVERGYIKMAPKLAEAAKESGWEEEYLPITYKQNLVGSIDLCAGCFKDFMDLKKVS